LKKFRGNVFLVGPMGAGKTTIGRHLSDILHQEFVDSDHEIEARSGANIPWIFDVEGEEGFRHREELVIDALTQRKNIVLGTGGGAVLRQANRQYLHERGTVVYLQTPVSLQLERTGRDRNRPLLRTSDPQQKLSELLALREPLYLEIAHIVMPTSGGSARDLAMKIVHALNALSG